MRTMMSITAMKTAHEAMCNAAYDEESYCVNPDLAEAADALRTAIQEAESATAQPAKALKTALQERDAEIEQLKSIAYSDDGAGGEGMKLFLQVRAQRRVLEQALEALQYLQIKMADGWDVRKQQELEDAAITAIQEQLS